MALTISSSGFPHLQRTQACRSLFGPVDHEELRSDLCREMNTIRRRDTQRWNFNFERDEPLDGQYSWLRVDCFASDIPPAYDGILRLLTLRGAYNLQSQTPRPTHARKIRVVPKPTSANQNLYTTVPTQTSTTTKTQHRAPSEGGKENAGGNCKRKLIQDNASAFTKVAKRRSNSPVKSPVSKSLVESPKERKLVPDSDPSESSP